MADAVGDDARWSWMSMAKDRSAALVGSGITIARHPPLALSAHT
jgi:hypothetical protein